MDEVEVGKALSEVRKTLAVAESCTGGLLAGRITAVPGSSAYFRGGLVAYDNAVKERILGVPREVLTAHGAVSAECAQAMAEGTRALFGSHFALAITGIAGPGGGTPAKPVGLVFLAVASPAGARVEEHRFGGTRAEIRESACNAALDLFLRHLGQR